jgi:hypothetical protein
VSAQAGEGAVWWPSANPSIDPSGVVVATVNYNTKRLVSMLLWSLYRLLVSELRSVVVVDNGSSDGSTELFQACERAGLCELILNATNRYHGPATNQALSHCASRFIGTDGGRPWIWLLDSDCVVARPDAATAAMSAAKTAGAALLGEAAWNESHQDIRCAGTRFSWIPPAPGGPKLGCSSKEAIRSAILNSRVDVSESRSQRFHSRRAGSSSIWAEGHSLVSTSAARRRTSSSIGLPSTTNRTSSKSPKRRRGTQRYATSLMWRLVICNRRNWSAPVAGA